jgi:hypothetical protein
MCCTQRRFVYSANTAIAHDNEPREQRIASRDPVSKEWASTRNYNRQDSIRRDPIYPTGSRSMCLTTDIRRRGSTRIRR